MHLLTLPEMTSRRGSERNGEYYRCYLVRGINVKTSLH